MKSAAGKGVRLALGIFILMSIITVFVIEQQVLQRLDYWLFDQQVIVHSADKLPANDIVVIAIDDYSLSAMKEHAGKWVWPRSIQAELIEALVAVNAKRIVYDILFSEKDIYRPDADRYLNEVVAQTDIVYFSMLVLKSELNQGADLQPLANLLPFAQPERIQGTHRTTLLLPNAVHKEYWQLGTINLDKDLDGKVRRYQLYQQGQDWQLASLPLVVTQSLIDISAKPSSIILNWASDHTRPYKTLSFADVYQAILREDAQYLEQLTNTTVLIGATAAGLYDSVNTPVNANLPGVYVLATAMDNLQQQDYFTPLPKSYALFATLVLIALLCFVFSMLGKYSMQLLITGLLVIVGLLGFYGMSLHLLATNKLMYVASPMIMVFSTYLFNAIVYGYRQYQKKQHALALFSRFLEPKVVLSLLEQNKLEAKHLNQKVQLTILFSDIRNFTSLSEQQDAAEVLALLNRYFSEQVSVIFEHHGTLDKFIGDCIMAFWGAPTQSDNQAVDAINTALKMEENLISFQHTLPEHLQGFDIGIGIHSGEAIAGLVGTHQRVDYTIIGDAVNLASRIEGHTKQGHRILVSEQTMKLAQQHFHFHYQGEHKVKGRQESVKLYRPSRR